MRSLWTLGKMFAWLVGLAVLTFAWSFALYRLAPMLLYLYGKEGLAFLFICAILLILAIFVATFAAVRRISQPYRYSAQGVLILYAVVLVLETVAISFSFWPF